MKKMILPVFMTLFFILGITGYGYPCTGAAYIDDEKTILWMNFDMPSEYKAEFLNLKSWGSCKAKGVGSEDTSRRSPKRSSGIDKPSPKITNGVNEYSLAVTGNATPFDVKWDLRSPTQCPAQWWLEKYRSVDEVLAAIEKNRKTVFPGPHFRTLGDKYKIAFVESTMDEYKVVVKERGFLVHANHYTFPEFQSENTLAEDKMPDYTKGSEKRARIATRFIESAGTMDLEKFKELALTAGVYRERTLANIIIYIPHNDEKPKIIYRFPKSQDKDWVEVSF